MYPCMYTHTPRTNKYTSVMALYFPPNLLFLCAINYLFGAINSILILLFILDTTK